jgi:hypothetical protein
MEPAPAPTPAAAAAAAVNPPPPPPPPPEAARALYEAVARAAPEAEVRALLKACVDQDQAALEAQEKQEKEERKKKEKEKEKASAPPQEAERGGGAAAPAAAAAPPPPPRPPKLLIDYRHPNNAAGRTETPLQAAHRLKRGDLVGAILEAGARDLTGMFPRVPSPTQLCVAYGNVASLRALLRQAGSQGGARNRKRVAGALGVKFWEPAGGAMNNCPVPCLPLTHLCVFPAPGFPDPAQWMAVAVSGGAVVAAGGAAAAAGGAEAAFEAAAAAAAGTAMLTAAEAAAAAVAAANAADNDNNSNDDDNNTPPGSGIVGDSPYARAVAADARARPRPRLDCLRAVVEAGANVDARDCCRRAAVHVLSPAQADHDAALRLLAADLRANLNARDRGGSTLAHHYAEVADLTKLRLLLDAGASLDVFDSKGWTPLMAACSRRDGGAASGEVMLELVRRSSARTVAVRRGKGKAAPTALDYLVHLQRMHGWAAEAGAPRTLEPWRRSVAAAMLRKGAPFLPDAAPLLLGAAGAAAQAQGEEMGDRRSEHRRWRAHDALVGLALDLSDARAEEEETGRKRRRVEELEAELGIVAGGEGGCSAGGAGEGGAGGNGAEAAVRSAAKHARRK